MKIIKTHQYVEISLTTLVVNPRNPITSIQGAFHKNMTITESEHLH